MTDTTWPVVYQGDSCFTSEQDEQRARYEQIAVDLLWNLTGRVFGTTANPVPEGGKLSAGILACEFWKAATKDNTCQLPQRVQSITRQGVTVAVLDAFDGLEKGRTGIYFVDAWVASVTGRRANAAGVLTPDRGKFAPKYPMGPTWPQAGCCGRPRIIDNPLGSNP